MNLIEIYTSGNRTDIAVFNLLFVFYAITTIAIIFGLLKFTKQNIAVNRFILGILSVYIGSLVAFDITFGIITKFGQQIPGPGAAVLLMFIGMAFGGALMNRWNNSGNLKRTAGSQPLTVRSFAL